MMLLLHILIALTSIVVSGTALVRPSRGLLRATYVLVTATLASGTYLVALRPSHLPSACISGLLYLAAVGVTTVAARQKLTTQTNR